jgi:hypothetical protein
MKKAGEVTGFERLRIAALRHPEVLESVACKGTAIESASFKVRGKAFLFLRPGTAMMKLGRSLGEASRLATQSSDRYKTGSSGWTTVALSEVNKASLKLIEKWVAESYMLFSTSQPSAPTRGKRQG